MDPLEQRIAIAARCGWKQVEPRVFLRHAPSHAFEKDGAYYGGLSIPDYCNDLNAMHEAEQTLSERDLCDYMSQLTLLAPNHWWHDCAADEMVMFVCAPAAQRAEAFLKALKLWNHEHKE